MNAYKGGWRGELRRLSRLLREQREMVSRVPGFIAQSPLEDGSLEPGS